MKMEVSQQGRRLSYQSQNQIGYTTLGSRKRRICLIKYKKGQKHTHTQDFSAIRPAIVILNSNAHNIAFALVGDHQIRDSHWSPPKADVKRERSYLKRALNHLQTSYE